MEARVSRRQQCWMFDRTVLLISLGRGIRKGRQSIAQSKPAHWKMGEIYEHKCLIRLPETGVEPATRALRMRCSTN